MGNCACSSGRRFAAMPDAKSLPADVALGRRVHALLPLPGVLLSSFLQSGFSAPSLRRSSLPGVLLSPPSLPCVALALLLFAGGAGRAVRFSTAEKSRFRKKTPTTPVRTNLGKRDCPFWPPSMLRPGKVPPPDKIVSLGSNPNPALPPASIEGAAKDNRVFQS